VSLLPEGAFLALAAAWLLLCAVSLVARIGPLPMVRGAFIALPFAFAAVPLIFTRPGNPLGTIDLGLFSLTISGEGLVAFATILLKSWVSVQSAALLVFTTQFHDLLEGLERLRLPRLMVAIISLMYRYLAVLTGEAQRMLRARASRAAVPPGARDLLTLLLPPQAALVALEDAFGSLQPIPWDAFGYAAAYAAALWLLAGLSLATREV